MTEEDIGIKTKSVYVSMLISLYFFTCLYSNDLGNLLSVSLCIYIYIDRDRDRQMWTGTGTETG